MPKRGERRPPTDESRALARARDKAKHMGKPSRVLPAEYEVARNIILKARQYGMDDRMIGDQIGMAMSGVWKVRTGTTKSMLRPTLEKILTLRPERIQSYEGERRKIHDGVHVPPHGTLRRLRALRADGYPQSFIGEALGTSAAAVGDIVCTPRASVFLTMREDVRNVYNRLAATTPEAEGVHPHQALRARNLAAKADWPRSIDWDDDQLDRPDGHPDWTGECGTVAGYFLHLSNSIRVKEYGEGHTTKTGKMRRTVLCEPCRAARRRDSAVTMKVYTDDTRAWVLEEIDAGVTVRVLADKIGCSTRTIERFKKERRMRENT